MQFYLYYCRGHMKNFFKGIKVGGISIKNVKNMIGGSDLLKGSLDALKRIMGKTGNILKNPPMDMFKTWSSGLVGKYMKKFKLSIIGGKLASLALMKASASKCKQHC